MDSGHSEKAWELETFYYLTILYYLDWLLSSMQKQVEYNLSYTRTYIVRITKKKNKKRQKYYEEDLGREGKREKEETLESLVWKRSDGR